MRALLALVVSDDLVLHQLDVTTAFLNGELDEDLYMVQPPGYEQGGLNIVCHLQRALYGLRQAPRAWHKKLKSTLLELGFTESESDPGLFSLQLTDNYPTFVLVYVYDMLLVSGEITKVIEVIGKLSKAFALKDMGEAAVFVGLEIDRNPSAGTLKVFQSRMAIDIVSRYGMGNAKGKPIPLNPCTKLLKDTGNLLDTTLFDYSALVGSLMYLAVCTRPDLCQAVGALARYSANPMTEHWDAALGVVRYLSNTSSMGIIFSCNNGVCELSGYCDADFAGDIDTRRSTTGYVFKLAGGAISWSSRLQPTVAASTTEAEYMAASNATKEGLWLRKLLTDLGKPLKPIVIQSDNQAAISLIKNPITSMRSKHIDVIHHLARERVVRGEVVFSYVNTADNVADMLTKPLLELKFLACCKGMGMSD